MLSKQQVLDLLASLTTGQVLTLEINKKFPPLWKTEAGMVSLDGLFVPTEHILTFEIGSYEVFPNMGDYLISLGWVKPKKGT